MYRNGSISKDLQQYLTPDEASPGQVKGNPKVHKKGNPMRLIVSGIGTATERIAEVAERELTEYVTNTPSYLRDTTNFLNEIDQIGELPDDTILFCFDVEKLYPSIPKKEGLEECLVALQSRSKKPIPDDEVWNMIKMVLENNHFEFNNKHYLQVDGTAIGSRLGKNYACTYMRQWDTKLLKFPVKPLMYKRFIDDGFGLWTEGIQSLQEFLAFANNIHPKIKVKMRWSKTSMEFLDTLVTLENNTIKTDLYSKPTDKHMYVNADSDHPIHTKKAIPYGLALRLRRICSKETDYERRQDELTTQLVRRGYKETWVKRQTNKACKIPRKTALTYVSQGQQRKSKRVPLVVTYSSHLPNLHDIVRARSHLLYKSEKMKTVFEDLPMIAYRRGRNMSDIVIHGKLNRITKKGSKEENSEPCGQPKCPTCSHMPETKTFQSTTGDTYTIAKGGNCTTRNVVYLISCRQCHKAVYVGETERKLSQRIKEHIWDTKARRDKPVANHFNNPYHSYKDILVTLVEKVREANTIYRRTREELWIKKLKTVTPEGLNIKTK